jgi:4-hydroxy-2-oxoglutarate aldolase
VRDFRGVYVTVSEPFRGADVAVERLKANLGRWNETSLSGYVVLGSTGEFPILSESERDAVLATARAASAVSGLGMPDGDGIEEIKESPASAGLR